MRPPRFSSVPAVSENASAAEEALPQPVASEEFAGLMAALGPFGPRPLLACAVSGGADSLALLHMSRAWASRYDAALMAFTVDHGLRPDAVEEAHYVQRLANRLGIKHRTLVWDDPHRRGAIQAAARAARLGLLTKACREIGCFNLLLAHHQDDQLETLLLRLARGSHLDGLAAMAPQRRLAGVRLLRPFLSIPKARLQATLRMMKVGWIEDPSNQDPRHERVQMRQLLERRFFSRAQAAEANSVFTRLRAWTEADIAVRLGDVAAFCPGGYAMIEPGALLALSDATALRVLSRVLQAVSASVYPPRGRSL